MGAKNSNMERRCNNAAAKANPVVFKSSRKPRKRRLRRVNAMAKALAATSATESLKAGGKRPHSDKVIKIPVKKRKQNQKSLYELEFLSQKPPEEILFSIKSIHFRGFKELLNNQNMGKSKLMLCLRLLSKACRSIHRESLKMLLVEILNDCSAFFKETLVRQLMEKTKSLSKEERFNFKLYVLDIMEVMQRLLPEKSYNTICLILLYSENCVTNSLLGDDYPSVIAHRYKNLHYNLSNPSEVNLASNFRDSPIFPSYKDLWDNCPVLRPNVIDGRYSNVQEYLEIQYRLMRQDFIYPLRRGIDHYRLNGINQVSQDVFVYTDVGIKKVTLTANGVEHELQFNSELCSHIDWEDSTRLINRTLVCLTSDEFNSVHFGTIIHRDPAKLKVGVVSVKFEKSSFMLNIVNDKFIMIESGVCFEGTHYVLSALQNMGEYTFPLKEYILDLDKNLKKPNYLNEGTVYCIHSILRHQSSRKGKCSFPVSLYQDQSWPTSKECNLDEAQLEALKSALRWRLSIIQGPPGTGKTYIGLKIIEVLLHNERKWNDGTPIMVVCYTNHALDQFLEGVLKITDKVVHIGGESNSEKLQPYTMKNLKQLRARKTNYMCSIFKDTKCALESLISEITTVENLLTSSRKNFLTSNVLKKHVKPEQYSSLFHDAPIYSHLKSNDVLEVISLWLGLEGSNLKENKLNDYCAHSPRSLDISTIDDTGVSCASCCEGERSADIAVEDTRTDIPTIHYHIKYPQISIDEELANLKRDIYLDDDASTSSVPLKNMDYFQDRERFTASSRLSTQDLLRSRNVWKLSTSDRWKLYSTWHDLFINELTLALEDLKVQYESKISILNEIDMEEQAIIAKNTRVIGVTTTGAAKYRNLVGSIRSKIIIVEEAAEVLEAQIVTSLSKDVEQLILIGDHQQLRPSPGVFELAKKFNLDMSLFERLIKNGMPFIRLGIQHRMRPEISRLLVPNIYRELANHPSVEKYSHVRGMVKDVFFVKHNHNDQQQANSTSKENIHEASFIVVLCRYLIQQGYEPSQITILTSYTGQLLAVKHLMTETVANVKAAVLDNYQGEENDIILLSLVRSNVESNIGFLSIESQICVALSRARKGLYCFGNFDLLRRQYPLWKNIILELTKRNQIGSELELKCQKHGNITTVRNCLDFDKVASGGCNKACGYRMPCGHLCEKRCHSNDNEHKESNCLQPCRRECPRGHKCDKMCFEDCGLCFVMLNKLLSKCCHIVEVPCYLNEQDVQCMEPCNLKLSCGHQCLNKCYEPCAECKVWTVVIGACDHPIKIQCGPSQNPVNLARACEEKCSLTLNCGHPCNKLCINECESKCSFLIPITLECGHIVRSQCYKSSNANYLVDECASKCDSLLKCGHKCSGTCSQCFQGRIHIPCDVLCDKKLFCGHSCKYTCCEGSCPPCSRKCDVRCGHGKCPNFCGEPCIPCQEKCDFYCKHSMCSQSCKRSCDRKPCNKVCKKKLNCKHKCIGMCGDICPLLCRVCDKETLKMELCDQEYKENERYIELEDCHHIFELQGFTKWMESQCDPNLEIKLICCPRCETPIRSNSRYELEVKLISCRVEQIKLKIYGKPEDNRTLQAQLFRDLKKFQTKYTKHSGMITYFSSTKIDRCLNLVLEQLSGLNILSKDTIINIENKAKVIEVLVKVEQECKEVFSEVLPFSSILYVKKIKDYAKMSGNKILKVLGDVPFLTTQLINDLTAELSRLLWMVTILKKFSLILKNNHLGVKECFDKILKILLGTKQLREFDFIHLDFLKDNLARIGGINYIRLNICYPILIDKELRPGKWYACLNGHVTCVNSNHYYCEECNVIIGPGSFKIEGNPDDTEPESYNNLIKNSSKKSDSSTTFILNYRASQVSQRDQSETEPNLDEVMETRILSQNCTLESSVHASNCKPTLNERKLSSIELKSHEVNVDSCYASANLNYESIDMKQGTVEVKPNEVIESQYTPLNSSHESPLIATLSLTQDSTKHTIVDLKLYTKISHETPLHANLCPDHDTIKLNTEEVIKSRKKSTNSNLNESRHGKANSTLESSLESNLRQSQDTLELERNEDDIDESHYLSADAMLDSSLPSLNSILSPTHDMIEFQPNIVIDSHYSSTNLTPDSSLNFAIIGKTRDARRLLPNEVIESHLFTNYSHGTELDQNVSPIHEAIESYKVVESHNSCTNSSHEPTLSQTGDTKTIEFIEKPNLSNFLLNSNSGLNQNSLNVSGLESNPNQVIEKRNSSDSPLDSNLETTQIGTKQDVINPKSIKDATLENSSTKPPTLLNLMTMPSEDDRFLVETKSWLNNFDSLANNEVGISKIIKTTKQKVTFNERECVPNSKPKRKVITFNEHENIIINDPEKSTIPKPDPHILKGSEQTNTCVRPKQNPNFVTYNERKNPTNITLKKKVFTHNAPKNPNNITLKKKVTTNNAPKNPTNITLKKKVAINNAPKNPTVVKHKRKVVIVDEPEKCAVIKHKRQFVIGDESENPTILKPKCKIITRGIPPIDEFKPKIISYYEPKTLSIIMPKSMTFKPENHTITKCKPKNINPAKPTITKLKTRELQSRKLKMVTYNEQELCAITKGVPKITTNTKPKHKLITFNESDSPTITIPKPSIITHNEPQNPTIAKPKTKIIFSNDAQILPMSEPIFTFNEPQTVEERTQNSAIAKPNPKYKPNPKFISYKELEAPSTTEPYTYISNESVNSSITKSNPKFNLRNKFHLETPSDKEPYNYTSNESENSLGAKFCPPFTSQSSHNEFHLATTSTTEPYTYTYNEYENSFIAKHNPIFTSRESPLETQLTPEPNPTFISYEEAENPQLPPNFHNPIFYTFRQPPIPQLPPNLFYSYDQQPNPQLLPNLFYSYNEQPNPQLLPNFYSPKFYSFSSLQNPHFPPKFHNPLLINQSQQNLFHPSYIPDIVNQKIPNYKATNIVNLKNLGTVKENPKISYSESENHSAQKPHCKW